MCIYKKHNLFFWSQQFITQDTMAVHSSYFVAIVQKPQTTFNINGKGKIKIKGIIKSTTLD